jgi:uncharacterized protein with HEPN domain
LVFRPRNILRHEYERIDPAIMWDIATVQLPKLELVVRQMLVDFRAK